MQPEKMATDEFNTICELGKFSKDFDFKKAVSEFFWSIICSSDSYKEELVTNCITKFSEMVKYWDMDVKQEFFIKLQANIDHELSTVSSLKVFKQLIKDQKDRTSYNITYSQQQASTTATVETEELTLAKSLDILITQRNLVSSLLSNLTKYCLKVKTLLPAGHTSDVSQRKKINLVNPKYSHHEEIDERLSFIKYLASVS